jgi:hypothetical protein
MAKKKRGRKAEMIREALEKNPDVPPKDLAELLNKQGESESPKLTFKPVEVSAYKSKLKKLQEGGSAAAAAPGRRAAAPAAAAPGGGAAAAATAAVKLVEAARELGADNARRILDAL